VVPAGQEVAAVPAELGKKALMFTRRKVLVGAVATAVSAAIDCRGQVLVNGSSVVAPGGDVVIPANNSGFLPAGHFINAKQAMIQIYPRPDTETNTYARHHRWYYDGVNSVQDSIPIGVAFGAFPYVFQLISGPPGMYIESTIWNTAWLPGLAAHTGGYGRLVWAPQSAISSSSPATVEILVTDQQHNTLTITFTVWTEGAYNASTKTGFIIVDNLNGSDSNAGTFAAPLASMGTAGAAGGAFGGSYTSGGGFQSAFPQAICYVRGLGTALYEFPRFTDNDTGYAAGAFELNCTTAPCAVIPLPGDPNPTVFDATGAGTMISTNTAAADMYIGPITASGYDATANNVKLLDIVGKSSGAYRQTFDGISWENSGYGAVGTDNATFLWTPGSAQDVQYIFATGLNETGRQSGTPGNNFGGCDLYSVINGLIQYSSTVNTSAGIDAAWFLKSEVLNVCLRGCVANYLSMTYGFGWLQGQSETTSTNTSEDCEVCYCLAFNLGEQYIPAEQYYQWGALWSYRNSFVASTHGLISANLIQGPNQQTVTTATTGGSLAASTYYYGVTAQGAGGGETSVKASKSVTTTGTTSVNTVPWSAWGSWSMSGQRVYRGVGSSSLTEYVEVANTANSLIDDGTLSWTSGSPPSSTTAWVTQGPYVFDSNAVETSYAQPTGENVQTDGLSIVVPSGGGLFNETTGQLAGSYRTTYLGTVGCEIA
jgi:hypothetical protein